MAAPQVTYYVVLTKQRPDIGGSVRPISRLIKESEDVTRGKLLTNTYDVCQRFAKRANAEGLRGQLDALGVRSFIVSDQEIRGHLFLYAATASKGAGGMAFRDFSDQPLFTPFDDICKVVVMETNTEDGKGATLIDLHRTSTNITPRLDAILFDFSQMMGSEDAGLEEFLKEIENRAHAKVDRRFDKVRAELLKTMEDFGSQPPTFEPPPAMLVSSYMRDDLRAANIYSFLLRQEHLAEE